MHESESSDSAVFIAEVSPSRAEYVRQIQATARATLARSRGNDEFQERAAEPLGVVPEWRSRGRRAPLAPRDRTQPTPAPASTPQPDAPTWAEERAAVFEAVTALRTLCENLGEQLVELSDQFAELRWAQLGTQFDDPNAAYHALNRWEDEERAGIEAAAGGPGVAPRLSMRSWSGPKHRGKARSRDDERRSRDDQGKEEPFEIPPLRTLRQT